MVILNTEETLLRNKTFMENDFTFSELSLFSTKHHQNIYTFMSLNFNITSYHKTSFCPAIISANREKWVMIYLQT